MSARLTRTALNLALLSGLAASASADPTIIGWCGTGLPDQPVPTIEPAHVAQPEPTRPAASPRVEVVFVLDTTGSMGGLIDGAKQTIWSIANAIATGDPHPDISMGLIGFRDRGDSYVTTVTPLTTDLDAVYSTLMGFSADGGGDGPESVNQALNEAITSISWSDDRSTLRMVYLVGDAPPHTDYDQDVQYAESARLAAERGIIINTIQCGGDASTTEVWQQIARAAEGEFFAIAQDGGVAVIATPFDEELSELGTQLGQTVVGYGDVAMQREQQARADRAEDLGRAAPAPAAAERAIYNASAAGGANLMGQQELVDEVRSGRVKLEELPPEQLPENMRDMTKEERAAYIEEQGTRRANLQTRINQISVQRQAFLDQARAEAGAEGGFDQKVIEALRRQAARFGIAYKQTKPTDG